jgi:hypothetical protein
MSISFKIALAINCIGILIALILIISDSIRQSAANNGPLLIATVVFCGWVGGSFMLYQGGYKSIAAKMAWLPAIPLLGYGLLILLFVILKPDMK